MAISDNTFRIGLSRPDEWQTAACLNWPDKYPYSPDVKFKVWHDAAFLHIIWEVRERDTKAEQTIPGGPVYKDSCVECFIQPDPADPHYYNFEFNAAGRLAMAYRTGRSDAEHAPLEVIASVESIPSLGSEPFAEKHVDCWSLEVAIPASALFRSGIASWAGRDMRMNFYKCGDGLSVPHYLSWAPISTPQPDYHRPEFFAAVHLEK